MGKPTLISLICASVTINRTTDPDHYFLGLCGLEPTTTEKTHTYEFASDQEDGVIEYQGLEIHPNVMLSTAKGSGPSISMQLTFVISRYTQPCLGVGTKDSKRARVGSCLSRQISSAAASTDVSWPRECGASTVTSKAGVWHELKSGDFCSILDLHLFL